MNQFTTWRAGPAPSAARATVRTYQGPANGLPPEVLALGRAESIHPPGLESLAGVGHPALVAFIGVAIAVGSVAAIVVLKTRGAATGLLALAFLGGCACLLFSLLLCLARRPTFLVFRDALVVVRGAACTVVPWDAVTQLNPGRYLVTEDGQTFHLHGSAKNLQGLYDAAHGAVMARLLPRALRAIEAGETLKFGPVTVSATTIGYRGKEVPWTRVKSLSISGPSPRTLNIGVHGAWLLWSPELSKIANDVVLLEVIRLVCPRHLLVPNGR